MVEMNMLNGSWKTTLLGLISAAFSYIAFSPDDFANHQWLVHLARFVAAGGLAGLGIAAKDYNVTGGTKQRPG
jgi:hypothetical protein